MNALFSGPLNRTLRQTLVVVAYGLLAAVLVTDYLWVTSPPPSGSIAWPHLLAILLVLPIFVRLERATGRAITTSHRQLDERQEALRNLAFRRSYQVVLVLMLFMLFAFALLRAGSPFGLMFLHATLIRDGFLVFFVLFFTLPTAIVAWLEPDPIPETEAPLGHVRGGAR